MDPSAIVYPAIAMFFLTFASIANMARVRIGAVQAGEMSVGFYRTYDEGAETPRLRRVTRHVQNLFEVPPLFYVVLIFLYVTGTVTALAVGLAWLYVALRCVHAFVHLGSNNVQHRLIAFLSSGLVLAGLWLVLLIGLLGSRAA